MKKSKQNHYTKFFNNNLDNLKSTWKGIKELINFGSTKTNPTIDLEINGEFETDTEVISNHFNDYFSTIAHKLSDKIKPSKLSFDHYLNNPNPNSFYIEPVTKEEILDYIKTTLKANKSTGPNSLPSSLLKTVSDIICGPLSNIINNSFSSGIFPDFFKLAKVIPIYKKGLKLDCSNYRPISLLSNIGKIFEKVMNVKLTTFLNRFNCFYKYRFGFRNKHSTTHTLIEITENIREALDNGNYACGVFIDLQKAFDTVNHDILFRKLNYYGVRGIALEWFKSYLSNRMQMVYINNTFSNINNIDIGVPQGSILGPLLFLIYVNDLNTCIKYSNTYHFADDTNLQLITKSLNKLNRYMNHDLANLVQWLRANKISLNTKKTVLILFKTPRTNFCKQNNLHLSKYLNFRISGQKLYPSKEINYLGIIIDENLSFKSHLNQLSIKLGRANGMLAKIRHYVNFETTINIYHAIFGCHLRYACQIWGQANKSPLDKIRSLQNKAMRLIHFQKQYFDPDILYLFSRVLKFSDMIHYLNCTFVWSFINSSLPNVFNEYFTHRSNNRYELRSNSDKNLSVPLKNTISYGIKSVTYQCILSWNSLPTYLKNDPLLLHSKQSFLKNLFEHFIERYGS